MDVTTIEKATELLRQLNEAKVALEKEEQGLQQLDKIVGGAQYAFSLTNGTITTFVVSKNTFVEALKLSKRETEQCIAAIEKKIAAL